MIGRVYKKVKDTNGGILAIGFSTLLVAISSTAAFSITPFFLHEVLKINLITIGLIEAITESLSQFSRLISGMVCDKMKKCRPMYLLGVFFSFIAKPVLLIANGTALVITSKIFDRLGNGVTATPRDSYVALHSPKNDKGANIGLVMTFKTIGCVVGPFFVMAAMFFYQGAVNLRWLLFLTTLPAFFAVFIALRYIPKNEDGSIKKNDKQFSISDLNELTGKFWCFLAVMFVFMLARTPECYLLLNLKQSGLPQWFCSGAIGFFNLVSVFISYPSGVLSDKYGRVNVLLISFLTLVASTASFATGNAFLGVIGVLFWGVQRASSQIVSVACISDLVGKHVLGSAIGLLNIVSGVAGIIASWLAGIVSERYGIACSYVISACFAATSSIFLFIFIRMYDSK